MGRLQTEVAKWEYREYDRPLTEQFTDGLFDKGHDWWNTEGGGNVRTLRRPPVSMYWLGHKVEIQRAQRTALNRIWCHLANTLKVWMWEHARWQMQVLQDRTCTPPVPCIQEEMQRMLQSQPFEGSLHILMETTGGPVGQEDGWKSTPGGQD